MFEGIDLSVMGRTDHKGQGWKQNSWGTAKIQVRHLVRGTKVVTLGEEVVRTGKILHIF